MALAPPRPDEWYDMAGRRHVKTELDGVLAETIFLHPTEKLPPMEPHEELVLPQEEPFDPGKLVFKFRPGTARDSLIARVGLIEAQISRNAAGRFEAHVIKGQTRISTRHSQPEGFAHHIPAMCWCDRILLNMR